MNQFWLLTEHQFLCEISVSILIANQHDIAVDWLNSQRCLCPYDVYNPGNIQNGACTAQWYIRGEAVAQSAIQVGSLLRDALAIRSTRYISKIIFTFSPICASTKSIAINSLSWKTWFFSLHQPPVTNLPFFFLVITWLRNDPRYLHNDVCIPHAPENMPRENIHYNLYPHLDAV